MYKPGDIVEYCPYLGSIRYQCEVVQVAGDAITLIFKDEIVGMSIWATEKDGRLRPYAEAVVEADNLVNHPPHYTFSKIEVLDAIEAWKLGFHEGQVVKYVTRAKHKGNELQDLKKARFYLDRVIKELENQNEKP